MNRWLLATVVGAALAGSLGVALADQPIRIGKNPGETKGRWLEVTDLEALEGLSRVAVGNLTTDIQYKKDDRDGTIDERILDDKIREHLVARLKETGLFQEVASRAPAEGEKGWLRLDCDLLVDPGSRAARYVVGLGAGKSKSVLEIFLRDHATGRDLGLYHGYGTGSGMGFKLAGGGARKMTQDDIQENAKQFAELLVEVR